MDSFKKALDELINSSIKLSEEWEKIDADFADKLAENYPFDKDFTEVIEDLKEWKKGL